MPDALTFLEIVAGILLLFGGGELFVAGAVALSLLLGIPQIVIGLTVVAFGTSALRIKDFRETCHGLCIAWFAQRECGKNSKEMWPFAVGRTAMAGSSCVPHLNLV